MVKVTLEGITHIYDKRVTAVKDLNVVFSDGEFTVLLGPSGCGKTTTMRIIAGLIRPTMGKVYFDDEDVTDLPAEKRNISMVFQFPVVYTPMTIYDNLAFPLKVKRLSKEEIRKRVKEIAEFLGIQQYLDIKPIGISADIKQKVALGRALIKESGLLLLDEPLTNIDPKARIELREKILEIKRKLKQTVIYVTHDQAEALTLADKIGVMKDGKMIQYDAPDEIYSKPKNTFVAWFIGNPGMNLVNATLGEMKDKYYIDLKGLMIHVPREVGEALKERLTDEEIIFGIRPEHVDVYKKKVGDALPGKCVTVEDWASLMIATVKIGEIELKVKTSLPLEEGEELWLRFPIDKIKIFNKQGELIYG